MINKYAEIHDRIRLYNACKGILRVKQANGKDSWLEDNMLRPTWDSLFGTGSYNTNRFNSFNFSPLETDYAKTNPNISSELATRANNYRNFKISEGPAVATIDAVPTGSIPYMSPKYRRYITENVAGSVLPRTNEGKGLTSRNSSIFGSFMPRPIKKPRRLESRKRSIDSYYNDLKANLIMLKNDADDAIDRIRRSNPSATPYNAGIEAANMKKERADSLIAGLNDELNKKKQTYAQHRQQNAQRQRELAIKK